MGIGATLLILGVSASPFAELRAGLPLAVARGYPAASAYVLAVAGNIAIVPVLLLGLEWAERFFMRWRFTRTVMAWVFARARRKGRWIERWGPVALILIVAIPLPGTGAWTGSLVARLLGIPPWKAFPWIVLGVLIAGGVVLAATLGAFHLSGIS